MEIPITVIVLLVTMTWMGTMGAMQTITRKDEAADWQRTMWRIMDEVRNQPHAELSSDDRAKALYAFAEEYRRVVNHFPEEDR